MKQLSRPFARLMLTRKGGLEIGVFLGHANYREPIVVEIGVK